MDKSADYGMGLASIPSLNLEAYRTDAGVHQMWVWILPLTFNCDLEKVFKCV